MGEFATPPAPEHEDYMASIEEFDLSQDVLREAALSLAKLPSDRRMNAFKLGCNYTSLVFQNTISIILDHEELDAGEKARTVATLYADADASRISLFESLAPDAAFDESSVDTEDLAEIIEAQLEAGVDPDFIVEGFGSSYAEKFSNDASLFVAVLRSTKKARALETAKSFGKETLEVGKIAAGAAIGIVIAQKTLKRYGK